MAEANPPDTSCSGCGSAGGSGCEAKGPPRRSAFQLESGSTGEQSSATPTKLGGKPKRHDAAILKIADVLTQQVVDGVRMALEEHLSRREAVLDQHLRNCEFRLAATPSNIAPDAAARPASLPILAPASPPSPGALPRPVFCKEATPGFNESSHAEGPSLVAGVMEERSQIPGTSAQVHCGADRESASLAASGGGEGGGRGARELMPLSGSDVVDVSGASEKVMASQAFARSVSPSAMWSSGSWAEFLPLRAKDALDTGQRRFLDMKLQQQRTGCVWEWITSSSFDSAVCAVILMNAVFSAMKADFDVQHPLDEFFPFTVCEYVFQAIFTFELSAKLWVYRIQFFVSEDWGWNGFDAILVVSSAIDQVVRFSAKDSDSGGSFSFMRAFRLLRVVKVFRLFRVVRFFRELYLMMASLVGALRSLFWSIVVIAFSLYIFALIFMQGVTSHLRQGLVAGIAIEEEDALLGAFGSMSLTIVTLFKSGTGGADWAEFYDLVSLSSPFYGAAFLLYVAFFGFAVVNVLTGMIVENVGENCRRTMEKDAEMERKKKEIAEMKKRMRELTEGGNGSTSALPWCHKATSSQGLGGLLCSLKATSHVSRQAKKRAALVPAARASTAVVPEDA